MKHTVKNYGFAPKPILPDQYVFGAGKIPEVVLQADGQWDKFLPVFEKQYTDKLETFGCTVFGTLNAREILKIKISGIEENYSDRDLYIISNTAPPGNDPHVVAEILRLKGASFEKTLPFRMDIKDLIEFASFELKEAELNKERLVSLERFEYLHEWVFTNNTSLKNKQALMLRNLQFSPLGVSVEAWKQKENGLYYKEQGDPDTHWAVLIGYEYGKYWKVYDTYPTSEGEAIKYLEWDYDFGYCKRYYLAPKFKKEPELEKETFWKLIINFLKKYLK